MEQKAIPAAGAPMPGATPPANKGGRTIIIVIVILAILCICCCVSAVALWFAGDEIVYLINPQAF